MLMTALHAKAIQPIGRNLAISLPANFPSTNEIGGEGRGGVALNFPIRHSGPTPDDDMARRPRYNPLCPHHIKPQMRQKWPESK